MVGRELLDPRSDQQTQGKKGLFVGTAGFSHPCTHPLSSTECLGFRSRMSAPGAISKLTSVSLPFYK